MIITFLNSFQSEWLKKKGSAASWLTVAGAFIIPVIILTARMLNFDMLYQQTTSAHFWENMFKNAWQVMAIFLLPMGVILATSLITQLEFKNNAWKQLHTLPQHLTVVFLVKLLVIVIMLLQFFILFNAGIYLAGIIPSFVFRGIPYPKEKFDFIFFLKENGKYFIDCLPIVALQYLLSLRFRNFLLPLGIGIGLLVTSMLALSWKFAYVFPYSYCSLTFMSSQSGIDPKINLQAWAIFYFIITLLIGYYLYISKKEKG